MMQRQFFNVSTSTTWVDTGPPTTGAIVQVRWYPTDGDTGADLSVFIKPVPSDTGDEQSILSVSNLGTALIKAPRQAVHDSAGAALASGDSPYVLAGDRIRVKVVAGAGAPGVGRLHVWTVK